MYPLVVTIAAGAAGGALFHILHMPLAWMMGAMVATTALALSGVRLRVPPPLRTLMVMVLGVLLGSTFTPAVLHGAAAWPVSLAGLAVLVAVATALLYVFLRRVLGFDPVTAYFAAAPGGLTEMTLATQDFGGDDRTVALIHASRILLTVLAIPLAFRALYGGSGGPPAVGTALTAGDGALLALCTAGYPLARLVRLPAAVLVGPMAASAAVHLAGLTASTPPAGLVAVAQVVVGCAIGARFAGAELSSVRRAMQAALASTALLLALTVLTAWALAPFVPAGMRALVLALSPGGLAEMSLIALALHVETAFVASHHVARILLVVVLVPAAFRWTVFRTRRQASAGVSGGRPGDPP